MNAGPSPRSNNWLNSGRHPASKIESYVLHPSMNEQMRTGGTYHPTRPPSPRPPTPLVHAKPLYQNGFSVASPRPVYDTQAEIIDSHTVLIGSTRHLRIDQAPDSTGARSYTPPLWHSVSSASNGDPTGKEKTTLSAMHPGALLDLRPAWSRKTQTGLLPTPTRPEALQEYAPRPVDPSSVNGAHPTLLNTSSARRDDRPYHFKSGKSTLTTPRAPDAKRAISDLPNFGDSTRPLKRHSDDHSDDRTVLFSCAKETRTLGLARIMHNNGDWDGPNNCIFKAMADVLLPSPSVLRAQLSEHMMAMLPEERRSCALSVLPETASWLNSPEDVVLQACVDRITSTGFIPADLFLSFLVEKARIGSIDTILKKPCSIVFLQEDQTRRYARSCPTHVFCHPSASELVLILNNSSSTHFDRLLPRKEIAGSMAEVLLGRADQALSSPADSVSDSIRPKIYDQASAREPGPALDNTLHTVEPTVTVARAPEPPEAEEKTDGDASLTPGHSVELESLIARLRLDDPTGVVCLSNSEQPAPLAPASLLISRLAPARISTIATTTSDPLSAAEPHTFPELALSSVDTEEGLEASRQQTLVASTVLAGLAASLPLDDPALAESPDACELHQFETSAPGKSSSTEGTDADGQRDPGGLATLIGQTACEQPQATHAEPLVSQTTPSPGELYQPDGRFPESPLSIGISFDRQPESLASSSPGLPSTKTDPVSLAVPEFSPIILKAREGVLGPGLVESLWAQERYVGWNNSSLAFSLQNVIAQDPDQIHTALVSHYQTAPREQHADWARSLAFPTTLEEIASFDANRQANFWADTLFWEGPRIPISLAVSFLAERQHWNKLCDVAFFVEDPSTNTAHLVEVLAHESPEPLEVVAVVSTIDGADYRRVEMADETWLRVKAIIQETPRVGKQRQTTDKRTATAGTQTDALQIAKSNKTSSPRSTRESPPQSILSPTAPPKEADATVRSQTSLHTLGNHLAGGHSLRPDWQTSFSTPSQMSREPPPLDAGTVPWARDQADWDASGPSASVEWSVMQRRGGSQRNVPAARIRLPNVAGLALANRFAALASLAAHEEPNDVPEPQSDDPPSILSVGSPCKPRNFLARASERTLGDFVGNILSLNSTVQPPSAPRSRRRTQSRMAVDGPPRLQTIEEGSSSAVEKDTASVSAPVLPKLPSSRRICAKGRKSLPTHDGRKPPSASPSPLQDAPEACPASVTTDTTSQVTQEEDDVASLGLAGLVSDRLPPTAQVGFPVYCTEDVRPLSITVKCAGRYHSVTVQETDCNPMDHLPEAILFALYPSPKAKHKRPKRLRLDFYGCVGDVNRSARLLRKLRPHQRPKTWAELGSFCGYAGYVELFFTLDGGADDGNSLAPQTTSSRQIPAYGDVQAWTALENAFGHLLHQGAVPSDAGLAELSQNLLDTIDLNCFGTLDRVDLSGSHVISPARVAALSFLIISCQPIPPVPLPAWVLPTQCLAARVNGLRVEDLASRQSRDSRPGIRTLTDSFISRLCSSTPELAALRLNESDPDAYVDMTESTRITTSLSGPCRAVDVQIILPPGDAWREALFDGTIRLTTESYFTLLPHAALIEVPLHPTDSDLLKALAVALNVESHSFRHLLAYAFSEALNGCYVQIRYSTNGPESRDHRSLVDHGPQSPQSQVVLGTCALQLLSARRRNRVVRLALGNGNVRPVSIVVALPEVPEPVLWNLISSAGSSALVPLSLVDASLLRREPPLPLVAGPLTKKWLTSTLRGLGIADQRTRLRAIAQNLHFHSSGDRQAHCVFLGRPQTPYAVMFECSNSRALTELLTFLSSPEGSSRLAEIVGLQSSILYLATVPLECLNLLGAQGMLRIVGAHATSGH